LLLATDTGGKPCAETVTPSEFPFRSHAASNANRATLTVRFVHSSLIFFNHMLRRGRNDLQL